MAFAPMFPQTFPISARYQLAAETQIYLNVSDTRSSTTSDQIRSQTSCFTFDGSWNFVISISIGLSLFALPRSGTLGWSMANREMTLLHMPSLSAFVSETALCRL